jgi:hypothetical protein
MRQGHRWVAGLLIVASLMLSACGHVPEEGEGLSEAATVEPIEGTDVMRVILTARAAERLDIRTDAVRDAAGSETVIPYAAVFYTANGDTWTYTNREPLRFVREPIVIDHIEGDLVFLSDGPPAGTAIVTQGAAELFGTETGVEE